MSLSSVPWPEPVEHVPFDEIPLDSDMFMIGAEELENFKTEWLKYLSEPDGSTADHPNAFLDWRWCTAKQRSPASIAIDVCITNLTRFHGVVRTIPKTKIVTCVRFHNYEQRAYLIVAQDWFNDMQAALFSIYALVDVVGVRALLEREGGLRGQQVEDLKARITALAVANPDIAFLSFADNVLVKANWTARRDEYESTYRPEYIISVVEEVRGAFRAALGLDSYAVVTQGSNQYIEAAPVEVSGAENHVFFGSLGTPFAQLFEIDQAIRAELRAKTHAPCSLYLSKTLLATLRFKSYETKGDLRRRLVAFPSKIGSKEESAYLPTHAAELQPLFRTQPED